MSHNELITKEVTHVTKYAKHLIVNCKLVTIATLSVESRVHVLLIELLPIHVV